jgi:ligand-binding SRPBCC domain-containing protein
MRLSFRSELPNHTPEEVFDWHERAGALERLTPPWGKAEVLHRAGGIKDGGRVSLRVRRGLASFRWDLKHRGYEYGRAFGEEQVDGPMRSWVHNHSLALQGR